MRAETALKQYQDKMHKLLAFTQKLRADDLRAPYIVQSISVYAYEMVRRRYLAYGRARRGSFGQKAATAGKEPSGLQRQPPTPARLPLRGAMADLMGVQALAKFVEYRKMGRARYRVYISPTAIHPATGKKWEDIAGWLEKPKPTTTMQETLWSLAYRIMIQEGRGGYGTRKRHTGLPEQHRGVHIRTNKAYPVWSRVLEDLRRKVIPKVVDKEVGEWLEKNVRLFLRSP